MWDNYTNCHLEVDRDFIGATRHPGGTTVNETYDANERRKLVKDGSTTIGEYMYAGAGGRVLEKRLSQAGVTLFRDYDEERRVLRHDQRRTSDDQRIAGYSYGWDRVGNRWYEKTLNNTTNTAETDGVTELYFYDSAYRMVGNRTHQKGVSDGSPANNDPRPAIELGAPFLGTTVVEVRSYDLDGVGNRREVSDGRLALSVYGMRGDDAKTNQYTFVDDVAQSYDRAGNLLFDGTWRYEYSAQNQLIRAVSATAGVDVRYRFDALGRRVSKRMDSGTFPGWSYGHAVYIQSGARILEEYSDGGVLRKEWVYGNGIDEPIRQEAPDVADIDSDMNTSETATLWYTTTSIGTVKALVDSSGVAREQYIMDVWGVMEVVVGKDGTSTGQTWTVVGNPWGLQGRQGEFEERAESYHFRARAYLPVIGEFIQRDPLGSWGDVDLLGNSRSLTVQNPANQTDPSGLDVYVVRDTVVHIGIMVDVWTNEMPCDHAGVLRYDFHWDYSLVMDPQFWGDIITLSPDIAKWSRFARGKVGRTGWSDANDGAGSVGSKVIRHYVTTPCEDRMLVAELDRFVANPPLYLGLIYNCGGFVQTAEYLLADIHRRAMEVGCCCKTRPPALDTSKVGSPYRKKFE